MSFIATFMMFGRRRLSEAILKQGAQGWARKYCKLYHMVTYGEALRPQNGANVIPFDPLGFTCLPLENAAQINFLCMLERSKGALESVQESEKVTSRLGFA